MNPTFTLLIGTIITLADIVRRSEATRSRANGRCPNQLRKPPAPSRAGIHVNESSAGNAGPSLLHRLHLDIASLSVAEFYPDGPAIVSLVNDTSYLP